MTTLSQATQHAPTWSGAFPRSAHLLGIGGVGMQGLAFALHTRGCAVSGTDPCPRGKLAHLLELGINVFGEHRARDLSHAEVVIRSSAVPDDNPELLAAQAQGVPVVHRVEGLALLLRDRAGLLVAGTHGKTTTTAMAGFLAEAAGLDPWVFVGGDVAEWGGYCRRGGADSVCVAETDESDGTFLRVPGQYAVVTNIEEEHLAYWRDGDALREGFRKFMERIAGGRLVVCADDPGVRSLEPHWRGVALSYGAESEDADYRIESLEHGAEGSAFLLRLPDGSRTPVRVGVPGRHNALNAAGALALAHRAGMDPAAVAGALARFRGVGRRFTRHALAGGVLLVDDYGHHVSEIEATVRTARQVADARRGRLFAVVQPHRYSRVEHTIARYGEALEGAERVWITDVYAAGEEPIPGCRGGDVAAVCAASGRATRFVPDPAEAVGEALEGARAGDVVLCLGAGSISDAARRAAAKAGVLA
ncbi:MAG: UDP-N-acetylmuramate--L-alanine ligase [Candidatus Sumerlaeia bacterium]|nr:UDP-N-acetylmuramate--L-alanine ligase [Candidatus Sumerlaeia bacterium]